MQELPRRRPWAMLLGLLAALCWGVAPAASLSFGELTLEYGSPWQRADAEEEARAEGLILRLPDAAAPLTVMLPRHRPRLRMPEERFYQQLETVWRVQYGEAMRVEWLEAAGRRWRLLRRPSVEHGERAVFHLVTVIDAHAHHLLVYAPPTETDLPEAVRRLLASAAPAPEPRPGPVAGAAQTVPSISWRLDRVIRIRPQPSDMDRLMALEGRGLGGEGGITGLMLDLRPLGLKGYVEGFVWVRGPEGREIKRAFTRGWELAWTDPPPLWHDDAAAAIVVSSAAGSDPVGLEIRLRYLCGATEQLRELPDGVERGQADAGERLEAGFAACRHQATGRTQAEVLLGKGETARPVLLDPPGAPGLPAGEQGLLVLSLRTRVGAGQPGHALLGAASVHYVYVRSQ